MPTAAALAGQPVYTKLIPAYISYISPAPHHTAADGSSIASGAGPAYLIPSPVHHHHQPQPALFGPQSPAAVQYLSSPAAVAGPPAVMLPVHNAAGHQVLASPSTVIRPTTPILAQAGPSVGPRPGPVSHLFIPF